MPVPFTHVPAQVLPVISVAERHRVGQRGGDHVARGDLDAAHAHAFHPVEPELVQRLEHLDELVAEPVLERHPPAVDPAWHEEDLLVLDVHAFHLGRCPRGT